MAKAQQGAVKDNRNTPYGTTMHSQTAILYRNDAASSWRAGWWRFFFRGLKGAVR